VKRRALLLASALLLMPHRARAKMVTGLIVAAAPVPVPAIDINDGDGNPAGLGQLRGRPVLLNLWASWCLPCVAELPALDRLMAADHRITVVALSLDNTGIPAAKAAYARMGIAHLGVRVDAKLRAGEALAASMLPITLLIDAEGREVARFVGAADWDSPAVRPLLDALEAGHPITTAMAPPQAKPHGAQPP